MSSFLLELWSSKNYTVPFKEISLCLSVVKSFDVLPNQKLYQLMLSVSLNFQIYVLLTYKKLYYCICFTKVNINFFFCFTSSIINTISWLSPNTEKSFFNYQYKMMKYYQHQKL